MNRLMQKEGELYLLVSLKVMVAHGKSMNFNGI